MALVMTVAGVAQDQDITGDWIGTLETRMGPKRAKDEPVDSPKQTPAPAPAKN